MVSFDTDVRILLYSKNTSTNTDCRISNLLHCCEVLCNITYVTPNLWNCSYHEIKLIWKFQEHKTVDWVKSVSPENKQEYVRKIGIMIKLNYNRQFSYIFKFCCKMNLWDQNRIQSKRFFLLLLLINVRLGTLNCISTIPLVACTSWIKVQTTVV